MSQDGVSGQWDPTSSSSEFNAKAFLVRMMMARASVSTLVKVVAVSISARTVDVQPLVNLLDGAGNATKHGTIYGLPYMRLQGGTWAFVVDPQVNDIGLCVFADRDISVVKRTKAQSNPGSRRRFDMADGIYLGGLLNGAPTQSILLDSNGVAINPTSGKPTTINSNEIVNGNETVNGNASITGTLGVSSNGSFGALLAAVQLQVNSGVVIKRILSGSVVTVLNSMGPGSTGIFTGTVTGAQVGDIVCIGPTGAQDAQLVVQAYVSVTNTITVVIGNPSANLRTAAAITYNIIVIGVT